MQRKHTSRALLRTHTEIPSTRTHHAVPRRLGGGDAACSCARRAIGSRSSPLCCCLERASASCDGDRRLAASSSIALSFLREAAGSICSWMELLRCRTTAAAHDGYIDMRSRYNRFRGPHMPEPLSDRWLLLIHQIPPKPSYFRVKIWRRLQRLGAVALKNSVYVLPRTEGEDLHGGRLALRRRHGGDPNAPGPRGGTLRRAATAGGPVRPSLPRPPAARARVAHRARRSELWRPQRWLPHVWIWLRRPLPLAAPYLMQPPRASRSFRTSYRRTTHRCRPACTLAEMFTRWKRLTAGTANCVRWCCSDSARASVVHGCRTAAERLRRDQLESSRAGQPALVQGRAVAGDPGGTAGPARSRACRYRGARRPGSRPELLHARAQVTGDVVAVGPREVFSRRPHHGLRLGLQLDRPLAHRRPVALSIIW